MNRRERYKQLRALQKRGLTLEQIADRVGLSASGVRNVFNDPDGTKQKERRERYRGTCKACGAKTDGSNGYKGTPDYCINCYAITPEHRAKITYWTEERIIKAIRRWEKLYGEPPAAPDWNPHNARHILGDEKRARRWETGEWPWFTSVVVRFGSWNAGIEAAGFKPRVPGGGNGNILRRRDLSGQR
jgi:transcriptional regulator with XRE-family HTH domain